MTAVDMALQPVVGRAVAVFLQRFGDLGLGAIEFGAFPENLLEAACLRAMGIIRRFAFGVVLAMDGDPFLGDHAAGQPQPEAKEMADDGVQINGAMRLRTMQKNSHGSDGDMGQAKCHRHISPPG